LPRCEIADGGGRGPAIESTGRCDRRRAVAEVCLSLGRQIAIVWAASGTDSVGRGLI